MKQNYTLAPLQFLFYIGVLVITTGCMNTSKDESTTFFGGKIKNPKDEYVYFSKNQKVIDSAKLDSNNKFSFYLDSIKTGLYTFNHGAEFQYLYLEPNDSLLIYLNTWDFDESIIFSGNQARKNNYLITLWLHQERFQKNTKSDFRLNEREFSKIIDNEINKQLQIYSELNTNEGKKPSVFFDKLAKVGIYYPLYYLKEYYPLMHKKYLGLKTFPDLSDDFYSYRNDLDLNDASLLSYGSYYSFINMHLYHLAYAMKNGEPENNNVQLNYMKAVNENIDLEKFKNKLLTHSIWKSLSNKYITEDESQQIQDYYFTCCTDEKMIEEIRQSLTQKELVKDGEKLPNVFAYNTEGEKVLINEVSNNTITVLYFWPKEPGYKKLLQDKLKRLEKEYPKILFIGIERDKKNEEWIHFIEKNNLSKDKQFLLNKNSNSYAVFQGEMDRTLIVDKNGDVQDSYLFFNQNSFDYHLKRFKNQ